MKVCTCNNCGNIFEDLNPSEESIEYSDFPIDELEMCNDGNDTFLGCKVCRTDEFLMDNINYKAMSETQRLTVKSRRRHAKNLASLFNPLKSL